MTKYEILAKSGQKYEDAGILDVQVFVKAHNKYYLFYSQDGVTVSEPLILEGKSTDIPLENWFFVENFEADDYFKLPEFAEAIDTYFMIN